ncbi:MAG: hypothetical protein KAY32_05900 [Candidatus Eisenbacteria sp.]|nr:hypothetical protein [Candidatus Eisenbacteria bacterium]
MIIVLTLGAAVVAAAVSLISPVTYESKLTMLPPESSSPLSLGRGNLQSSLASLQMGFATTNTSALYADMIRSRAVRRYAVDALDLLEIYGIDASDTLGAYTRALNRLEADMEVSHKHNGLIMIKAQAHTGYFPSGAEKERTRHLSARIANALAEGLDVVNQQKNTNQARQARIYLEEQVGQTDEALEEASKALAEFQKEHLAISLDDQMRVTIETAGTLEGELLAKEVALGVAVQTMRSANPVVQRLQSEIAALRNQLVELRRGGTGVAAGVEGDDSLQFGLQDLPEIGRQYAFLLRDLKIQETVYELLTQQLYHARIKETETLPVIQVLDEASVPIDKKKPIARKVTVVAALLGLLFAIFLAHALEWWSQYEWAEADLAVLRRLWRRSPGRS